MVLCSIKFGSGLLLGEICFIEPFRSNSLFALAGLGYFGGIGYGYVTLVPLDTPTGFSLSGRSVIGAVG